MCPDLELTWSVGRQREGLNDSLFRSLVGVFKKHHDSTNDEYLKKLEVVIKEEDDNEEEKTVGINMFSEQLFALKEVQMNDRREKNMDDLLETACDTLQENYNELDKYISKT